MTPGAYRHQRLRDLPEPDQSLFRCWLLGQTRPIEESLPDTNEEQDFYYRHDYERWKELAG